MRDMRTDITVRPQLFGHFGTSTYMYMYLDERFVQIWELYLNTASWVGFIHVIMHLLIATVFYVQINEK